MALGSTHHLTKMNTRNISGMGMGVGVGGFKGGRCLGLTLQPSRFDCLENWEPEPPGTLKA
jgi:hypothetical protein